MSYIRLLTYLGGGVETFLISLPTSSTWNLLLISKFFKNSIYLSCNLQNPSTPQLLILHYTNLNKFSETPPHIMSTSTNLNTSTESRALSLLGSGIPPETVAATLGVSASRISQLLSTSEFAAQVAELRFQNLQVHNERDSKYDQMEDALLDRMRDCLPLMMRPMEILKAIQVINAAKRRGASAPETITAQQTIISLTIPVQIIQKFQTTQNKQVTHAGEQELLTMQSSTLLKEIQHEPATVSTTSGSSRARELLSAAANL